MDMRLLKVTLAMFLMLGMAFLTCSSCSRDDTDDDDDTDNDSADDDDTVDDDDAVDDDAVDDDDDDDEEPWACDDEVCVDTINSLMWQKKTDDEYINLTWYLSKGACSYLFLAGYSDWHLPTMTELRTLIVGCADTMPGGACNASDECNIESCNNQCDGCDHLCGPGSLGRYWRDGLEGDSNDFGYWYWTSTLDADDPFQDAWYIDFSRGEIDYTNKLTDYVSTRCVRTVSEVW